jgi:hypothetical protein
MSVKNHDKWCIPLCQHHHAELDSPGCGPVTFEQKYRIDMKKIAAELWRISPARIRWEQRKAKEASNV